jgi:hypothetical integral membrane protein (TIGR02206 family)
VRSQTAQFSAYGPSYWAVVAVFAVGAVVVVLAGRSHRGGQAALRFSRAFAVLILLVQVPFQVRVMLPGHWNVTYSLPLQLCDLAWISAVVALWTHRKWAYSVTYYWGVTLTSQALITPELTGPDFPSPEFLMFWCMHCFIVWSALYLTWGLGFRPDWRSYRITVLVTACWAVAMVAFNAVTGSNYGFLNHKPPGASLLNVLGGWPWYLATEVALALAVWALITLPWTKSSHPKPDVGRMYTN